MPFIQVNIHRPIDPSWDVDFIFRFAANGWEQFQEFSYHMMSAGKQRITWCQLETGLSNSSVIHCKFKAKNQCSKKCNLGAQQISEFKSKCILPTFVGISSFPK